MEWFWLILKLTEGLSGRLEVGSLESTIFLSTVLLMLGSPVTGIMPSELLLRRLSFSFCKGVVLMFSVGVVLMFSYHEQKDISFFFLLELLVHALHHALFCVHKFLIIFFLSNCDVVFTFG